MQSPFDGVPVGDDPLLIVADRIITMDPARPAARAVLVQRRRLTWLGDDPNEVADEARWRVELPGVTLQPAFVNAHTHLTGLGLILDSLDVGVATSLEDCLAAIRVSIDVTTDPVIWGAGWDETAWPDQRLPSAEELKAAGQGRPVILTRSDGHCVLVDAESLRALPLARSRGVERDATGQPTGLLRQEAAHVARRWFGALLPEATLHRARRAAARELAAAGVASAHEMGGPHRMGADDFDAWLDGQWAIEVVPYWGDTDLDFAAARGLRQAGGSLLLDGTIGAHSAALESPYADRPGSGQLYRDTAELIEFVQNATRRGMQVGLHAIGDRAVHQAIRVFMAAAEDAGPEQLRNSRHRLEYAALVDEGDVAVLAELGIVVTAQPVSDLGLGRSGGSYERRLGAGRARAANPLGLLSRAGVQMAFGADDIGAFDPWAWVRAAGAHHEPDSRMTWDQALQAATIGGRAAARQGSVGALRPGNRADLAAFEAQGEGPGKCVLTMVAGTVVHGAALLDTAA
ncbi:amidohydrolase [Euzebya tangerina]|uniref:amidohydrolase n=1 Tax=Euzebya tangerina TaxID=591198 RepID=UPI0013C36875|nr:amidohydrolase family protein [Euzebya tangerina]